MIRLGVMHRRVYSHVNFRNFKYALFLVSGPWHARTRSVVSGSKVAYLLVD